MRINQSTDYTGLEDGEELKRYLTKSMTDIMGVINGGIDFGENVRTSLISVAFGGANTTVQSGHGLGRVPAGYIVAGLSANMVVFNGSGTNTDKLIYLQASAAGTASVLVF